MKKPEEFSFSLMGGKTKAVSRALACTTALVAAALIGMQTPAEATDYLITTPTSSIINLNSNGDTLTVTSGGSITGNQSAVLSKGGINVTIDNSGTLTGTLYGIRAYSAADISGGITNSGTISGVYGLQVDNYASVSGGIVNAASGVITAAGTTGDTDAIFLGVAHISGGITNSGTLAGNLGRGLIVVQSTVSEGLVNNASGTITGQTGIDLFLGHISGGIDNSGSITGTLRGIVLDDSSTVKGGITNRAGGVISGGSTGIQAVSYSIISGGIHNAGTISGSVGIKLESTSMIQGGITNSGTITGAGGKAMRVISSRIKGDFANDGDINGELYFSSSQLVGDFINNGNIVNAAGNAISLETAARISGALLNSGTISGAGIGIDIRSTEANIRGGITNNGSIHGDVEGIHVGGRSGAYMAGGITNYGSITSNAGTGGSAIYVGSDTGVSNIINHSGGIISGDHGIIFKNSIHNGGIINDANATISDLGSVSTPAAILLEDNSRLLQIDNSGTIESSLGSGIYLNSSNITGFIRNRGSGVIEGDGVAAINLQSGNIFGGIINENFIQSSGGGTHAVNAVNSNFYRLYNSGQIQSPADAISMQNSYGYVINTGTITSSSGAAIRTDGGAVYITNRGDGVISGNGDAIRLINTTGGAQVQIFGGRIEGDVREDTQTQAGVYIRGDFTSEGNFIVNSFALSASGAFYFGQGTTVDAPGAFVNYGFVNVQHTGAAIVGDLQNSNQLIVDRDLAISGQLQNYGAVRLNGSLAAANETGSGNYFFGVASTSDHGELTLGNASGIQTSTINIDVHGDNTLQDGDEFRIISSGGAVVNGSSPLAVGDDSLMWDFTIFDGSAASAPTSDSDLFARAARHTYGSHAFGQLYLSHTLVAGGVRNSGVVQGTVAGIGIFTGSDLSGGLENRGDIYSTGIGVVVQSGSDISGGLLNKGTIQGIPNVSSALTAIQISNSSSISGGIENRGYIHGLHGVLLTGASDTGEIHNAAGAMLQGNISSIELRQESYIDDILNEGYIYSHSGRAIIIASESEIGGGISNSGYIRGGGGILLSSHGLISGFIGNDDTGVIDVKSSAISLSAGSTIGGISNRGILRSQTQSAVNIAQSFIKGNIRNRSSGTIYSQSSAGITFASSELIGSLRNDGYIHGHKSRGAIEFVGGDTYISGIIQNNGRLYAGTGLLFEGVYLTGNVENNGTIIGLGHGISLLTNSRIAGTFSNQGVVYGGSTGIRIVETSSRISGGIYNSGYIGGSTYGINFSSGSSADMLGGIENAGIIQADNAIYIGYTSNVHGAIRNEESGRIMGQSYGIAAIGTKLDGGIDNKGLIQALSTGIRIASISTVQGGVTNSGQINGNVGIRITNASVSGGVANDHGYVRGSTYAMYMAGLTDFTSVTLNGGRIVGDISDQDYNTGRSLITIGDDFVADGNFQSSYFEVDAPFTIGSGHTITVRNAGNIVIEDEMIIDNGGASLDGGVYSRLGSLLRVEDNFDMTGDVYNERGTISIAAGTRLRANALSSENGQLVFDVRGVGSTPQIRLTQNINLRHTDLSINVIPAGLSDGAEWKLIDGGTAVANGPGAGYLHVDDNSMFWDFTIVDGTGASSATDNTDIFLHVDAVNGFSPYGLLVSGNSNHTQKFYNSGALGGTLYGVAVTTSSAMSGGIDNSGRIAGRDGSGILVGSSDISGGIINRAGAMISGPAAIVLSRSNLTGTIDNSGSIIGGNSAITAQNFSDVSGGMINRAGGLISAQSIGIYITTYSDVTGGIDNSGIIRGGSIGIQGVTGNISGGIVNHAGGTIRGDGMAAIRGTSGFAAPVTNEGTIYSLHGTGILMSGVDDFGLNNSGDIFGAHFGVSITHSMVGSNIVNDGSISSNDTGLAIQSSTVWGDVRNNNLISGNTAFWLASMHMMGAIANAGTIAGTGDGVDFAGADIYGVFNNSGTIRGAYNAMNIGTASHLIGGLVNSGLIAGGLTAINASSTGSSITGGLNNSGTISAANYGLHLVGGSSADMTGGIENDGSIIAWSPNGDAIYVGTQTLISGAVTNRGTIMGGSAIYLDAGSLIKRIDNSGNLVGTSANAHGAIDVNGGNLWNLDNSGEISAVSGAGIHISNNNNGTIITNSQGGDISGDFGIYLDSSGSISMANSGIIRGASGTAIRMSNIQQDAYFTLAGGQIIGDIIDDQYGIFHSHVFVTKDFTTQGDFQVSEILVQQGATFSLGNNTSIETKGGLRIQGGIVEVNGYSSSASGGGITNSGVLIVNHDFNISGGFTNNGTVVLNDTLTVALTSSGGIYDFYIRSATDHGEIINQGSNIAYNTANRIYLAGDHLLHDGDEIRIAEGTATITGVNNGDGVISDNALMWDFTYITGGHAANPTSDNDLFVRATRHAFGTSDFGVLAVSSNDLSGGVTNTGTLFGNIGGIGVFSGSDISGGIANTGGSTISGGSYGIILQANANVTGGIDSAGIIHGALDGIAMTASSILTGQLINEVGGSITGGQHGITLLSKSDIAGGILNQGLISGAVGIYALNSGNISGGIDNSGTIHGWSGIDLERESDISGTLYNHIGGEISSSATSYSGGGIFVYSSNLSGGVLNNGMIDGAAAAGIHLIRSQATGSIYNASSGIISGYDGIGLLSGSDLQGGLTNDGTIKGSRTGLYISRSDISGGFSNAGTVSGDAIGIEILGSSRVTGNIYNNGTIHGDDRAIVVTTASDLAGGLQNYGDITADHQAIFMNGTASTISGGIINAGLIRGGTGIYFNGNSSADIRGGISNSGTIDGVSAYGIFIGSSSNVSGGIDNSGTISGQFGIFINHGNVSGGITNESGGRIISTGLGSTDSGILVQSGQISGGIDNSGTISGRGMGIYGLRSSFDHFINNSTGIISGDYGIFLQSGHITNGIVNEGIIRSTSNNTAIYLNNLDRSTPLIIRGGRIIGDVIDTQPGNGYTPTTIAGNFTSEGNFSVSDFSVASGAIFTLGANTEVRTKSTVPIVYGTMVTSAYGSTTHDGMEIAFGGKLDVRGNFTVGGTLDNGGTVHLGIVGPLNVSDVAGNGKYIFDVSSSGAHGLIRANDFTLNNTNAISINVLPGTLTNGADIILVDSVSSIVGSPGASGIFVTDNSIFWNFKLLDGTAGSSDDTDLYVRATQATGFASYGLLVHHTTTLSGGVHNTGILAGTHGGIGVLSSSAIVGGIDNSGIIAGRDYAGIEITSSSSISGGVINRAVGTISGGSLGIVVRRNSSLTGSVDNSGLITGKMGMNVLGNIDSIVNRSGGSIKGSQWAGLSIASSGDIAGGIQNQAGGLISGMRTGISIGTQADLSGGLDNSGIISGGNYGLIVVLTLNDMSGAIANNASGHIQGITGISVTGSFADLSGGIMNAGVIEGMKRGISVNNSSDISGGINNVAGGFIRSTSHTSGSAAAIYLRNGNISGGILNNGTIEATYNAPGIAIYSSTVTGNVTNQTDGVIAGAGSNAGILVRGPNSILSGQVINHGLISGQYGIVQLGSLSDISGGIINETNGRIIGDSNGVYVQSTVMTGTIDNSGLISTRNGGSAIYAGTHANIAGGIINRASGIISSGDTGILIVGTVSNVSGGIDNSGLIHGGSIGISFRGQTAADMVGGIANSGTISAGAIDILVNTTSTISGGINNSGDMTAASINISVGSNSSVSDITNSGIMHSNGYAAINLESNAHAGNITNLASGEIRGAGKGISVITSADITGMIDNQGLISGGSFGIHIARTAHAMSGGINNSGTIHGGSYGIYVNDTSGIAGGIVNSGTIEGAAAAIRFDDLAFETHLSITGGHIIGDVYDNNAGNGFSVVTIDGNFTSQGNFNVSTFDVTLGNTFTFGLNTAVTSDEDAHVHGTMIASNSGASIGGALQVFSGGDLQISNAFTVGGNIANGGAVLVDIGGTLNASSVSGGGDYKFGVTSAASHGLLNVYSGAFDMSSSSVSVKVALGNSLVDGDQFMIIDGSNAVLGGPGGTPVTVADNSAFWNFQLVDGTGSNAPTDNTDLFLIALAATGLASYGQLVNGSTNLSGGINNSGTLAGTIAGIGVLTSSDISGGVVNTGTVTGQQQGIVLRSHSDISGGIDNSGAINGGHQGILVTSSSDISGGVLNQVTGTISGGDNGIYLAGNSAIRGGIENYGLIQGNGNLGIGLESASFINNGIINHAGAVIYGGQTGMVFGTGSTVTGGIDNGGRISGGVIGISLVTGEIDGALQNSGLISGISTAINMIYTSDITGGIINTGTISAGQRAIGLHNGADLSGGIDNAGLIISSSQAIHVYHNADISGGIINHATGMISGYTGVNVQSANISGGIVNEAGAHITSTATSADAGAIYVRSGDVSGGIDNSGILQGDYGNGLRFVSSAFTGQIINRAGGSVLSNIGSAVYLSNSDLIQGITNSGLMSGGSAGIQIGPSADISGGIDNAGTITGDAGILMTSADISGGIINRTTGTIEGRNGSAIIYDGLTQASTLSIEGGHIIGGVVDNAAANGFSVVNIDGNFTSQGNFDVSDFNVSSGKTFTFGAGNSVSSYDTVDVAGAMTVTAAGSLVHGDVDVHTGGMLNVGGNFSVIGVAQNNGTVNIATGNTLALDGMAAGTGSLVFGVTSAANHALLNVSGQANLTGQTISIDVAGVNSLVNNDQFRIINGIGSIIGGPGAVATTVADNSVLWDFKIIDGTGASSATDDSDLFLIATQPTNVQVDTPNNQTVLDVLQSLNGHTSDPQMQDVLANLNGASTNQQLNDVLESVQSTVDSGYIVSALEVTGHALDLTGMRLEDLRSWRAAEDGKNDFAEGSTSDPGAFAWTQSFGFGDNGPDMNSEAWPEVFGQTAHQGRRQGIDGYSSTTVGSAFGMDTGNVFPDGTLGAAFSYAHTTVNSDNINSTLTKVSSYQATLYGDHRLGNSGYISGMAAYVMNDNDTTRFRVGVVPNLTARGAFDSSQIALRTEVGEKMIFSDVNFTPSIKLNYMHFNSDKYSETGAGGAGLNVGSQSLNSFEIGIGGKLDKLYDLKNGDKVRPEVHAGYRYEMIGNPLESTASFNAGGASFTTEGFDPARHRFNLGTSVKYYSGKDWDFTAAYEFDYKEDYTSHSGYLRAAYKF